MNYQQPMQEYNPKMSHDYKNNKLHSDYGHILDSDIARLRMEVNLQHKSLEDQISASKFKARQAAQERNLAKNDLERLITSVNNKTKRFFQHERPLNALQGNNRLRTERTYNGGSSHSRRNLEAYSKLYFNNFNTPGAKELIHNDRDPFNINIAPPEQPKMYYQNSQENSNRGAILNTNSQTVSFDSAQNDTQNFNRSKADPSSYAIKQFGQESSHDMNQIGNFYLILC